MEAIVVGVGSDTLGRTAPDEQVTRKGKRRSARKRVAELQVSADLARMVAISSCVAAESLACAHEFDPASGDGL